MNQDLVRRLQHRLQATGKSVRGASLNAGLSESALKDILSGKNASPRMETLGKIARALDCDPAWLAFGSGDEGGHGRPSLDDVQQLSSMRGFGFARVDGLVKAGNWIEVDVYDEDPGDLVSAPRDPDFPHARQIAYRVGGDSMNRAEPRPLRDGDIIVCVAFEDIGLDPTDGMLVVVQRTRHDGSLRERSVKVLKIHHDRTEFLPKSDNPAHKPIVVPLDHDPDDTTRVEILALVRFVIDNIPLPAGAMKKR